MKNVCLMPSKASSQKHMKSLAYKLLGLAEKAIHRNIIAIPINRVGSRMLAAKSTQGFWYVGNIFSRSDISYGVAVNGCVEAEGTKLVSDILESTLANQGSCIFYDIGANTGYYGIMASFLGKGSVTTYAFEPLTEYNEIEREAIRLNRLENFCFVFPVALGREEKQSEAVVAGSGTTLRPEFLGSLPGAEKRTVRQVPLDAFVVEQDLRLPDFMKIDVEGFEREVLEGALGTIRKNLPVIWYESAKEMPGRNFKNKEFAEVQSLVQRMGYRIFMCNGDLLVPVSHAEPRPGVEMYLAVHPARHEFLYPMLAAKHALPE